MVLGEPVPAVAEMVGEIDQVEGRAHRLGAGLPVAYGHEVENGEGGDRVVHSGINSLGEEGIPLLRARNPRDRRTATFLSCRA